MIKVCKPLLINSILLILATNLLISEVQAAKQQCAPKDRIFYNSPEAQERRTVIGNYEIKTTKHNTFTIKQAGKLVYSDCDLNHEVKDVTGWSMHFKNDDNHLPVVGEDITGNGIPKLVIYYSYNATYCCGSIVVFELGKKFKKIAKIESTLGDIEFVDIDGDKFPEIMLGDSHYFRWHTGEASNDYPYPKVILKWNGTEYVLRSDLMRKAPPEISELINESKRISTDERWGDEYNTDYIPLALIQKSLDLMYSGNEELGWKFARMAWSNRFPVDDAFFTEWKNKMAQNPVWQAIIHNRNIPASEIKTALELEPAQEK